MQFNNRYDAAMALIPLLEKYKDQPKVFFAVPRGGVPIAFYIAKYFHSPLELLMTKKIGHPANPEYAIGAVSMDDYMVDDSLGVPSSYISREADKIKRSLKERYEKFMGKHTPVDIENKVVVIIDDGVATGRTILSSIKMLKEKKPKKIIVAVPVAPPQAVVTIKKEVDDFICLYTPQGFIGVGLYYADFSQVSDEEVIELLNESRQFEKKD